MTGPVDEGYYDDEYDPTDDPDLQIRQAIEDDMAWGPNPADERDR